MSRALWRATRARAINEAMSSETPAKPSKQKLGEFFAIDARTWAQVCALGMNPAVAYLVLACFSGRDNTHTNASVNAIEKHTGIARTRARDALQQLIDANLVRQTHGGTKPRYELAAFAELPGAMPSPAERAVHKQITEGKGVARSQRALGNELVRMGWATLDARGAWHPKPLPSAEPALTWLPNALVTGAVNEQSPVERVRQTTDKMCLRLLVDLYTAQNLRDDGGVSRKVTYRKHERTNAGEYGEYIVWGFKAEGTPYVRDGSPIASSQRRAPTADDPSWATDLFKRLTNLERLGLIDWTPYLCESEDADAEVVHPLGFSLGKRESESQKQLRSLEERLAKAAHDAGARLLGRSYTNAPGYYLVPVRRHVERVAVVSVARLHYRPRTTNTKQWWGDMQTQGAGHIARYQALGAERASIVKAAG